jgi:hypothetical protein
MDGQEESGVSDWRDETAADLADAQKRIEALLRTMTGEPSGEQVGSVWMAYVKVEKSVAFIKFDLDEDNPGRFVRLKSYVVPDERQALQFALRNLKKGTENFSLGDFRQSLKDLRESRNYLRALLREKRLKRARDARGG